MSRLVKGVSPRLFLREGSRCSPRAFSSLAEHHPSTRTSARIAHLRVEEKSIAASAVVSAVCHPGGADARTLIRTGAVYRATVGAQPKDAQRLLHDVPVYEGEYLRVHLSPRRYDIASIPWEKLVVHHAEDFIVLNKPAGVPTVPTTDNYYENVVVALQQLLSRDQLYPTQRLDTDTTGLLVIGKTREFASYFSKILRQNGVTKVYKALVAGATIPHDALRTDSPLVHYTPVDSTTRPRIFTADPSQFAESKLCEMSVLSVKDIGHGTLDDWIDRLISPPLNNDKKEGARKKKIHRALERYCNVSPNDVHGSSGKEISFAEVELQLVTGRTHQIRGQLSAVGEDYGGGLLHVAGDNMYQGISTVEYTDKYKSSPYLALQVAVIFVFFLYST